MICMVLYKNTIICFYLSFLVVPNKPTIDEIPESYYEGENVSIRCFGNVGRPAGELIWSRRRLGELSYFRVRKELVAPSFITNRDKTVSAVSILTTPVTAFDDAALYRCSAESDVLPSSNSPFHEVALNVQCKYNSWPRLGS